MRSLAIVSSVEGNELLLDLQNQYTDAMNRRWRSDAGRDDVCLAAEKLLLLLLIKSRCIFAQPFSHFVDP